jgi:hypothetical protein
MSLFMSIFLATVPAKRALTSDVAFFVTICATVIPELFRTVALGMAFYIAARAVGWLGRAVSLNVILATAILPSSLASRFLLARTIVDTMTISVGGAPLALMWTVLHTMANLSTIPAGVRRVALCLG